MSQPAERTLSPQTPVDAETLDRLQKIQGMRLSVANQLLDMELDKVRLLASATRLDNEKTRIFEAVLMERGLPPNKVVEIDGETGVIKEPGTTPRG